MLSGKENMASHQIICKICNLMTNILVISKYKPVVPWMKGIIWQHYPWSHETSIVVRVHQRCPCTQRHGPSLTWQTSLSDSSSMIVVMLSSKENVVTQWISQKKCNSMTNVLIMSTYKPRIAPWTIDIVRWCHLLATRNLRNYFPQESLSTKKAIIQEAHLKSLTRTKGSWPRIRNASLWNKGKRAGMTETSKQTYHWWGIMIPQQSVTSSLQWNYLKVLSLV